MLNYKSGKRFSDLLYYGGYMQDLQKKADSSQIILSLTPGKMVCTGDKSEKDSRLAARKFGRIVQARKEEFVF